MLARRADFLFIMLLAVALMGTVNMNHMLRCIICSTEGAILVGLVFLAHLNRPSKAGCQKGDVLMLVLLRNPSGFDGFCGLHEANLLEQCTKPLLLGSF